MSSSSINRKDFLVLTVSSATIAAFLEACGGEDPPANPGTGGTGTGGTGTAGTGTAGTTAGTGTAGTGTAGTGTAGTGTAGTGTAGQGGSGGGSGGSGGASGGSGGSGGGGGGTCGMVSIMQTATTANDGHTHIPADATQLKADLKMLINGANSTMEFTLPNENNHTHKIKLTVPQVMSLKSAMMVTGIVSDGMHTHTYTIGCTA